MILKYNQCTSCDPCHASPRYLLSDACVLLDKPLVSGSALRWEGQLTVYNWRGGPTYRCLYAQVTISSSSIAHYCLLCDCNRQ